MKVPFLDLKAQYESIKDEVAAAIQQVLDKTAFAGGPFITKFEKEFAAFCHTQYAIGVGSGTDALWLALSGLGIGPGDEVITVPTRSSPPQRRSVTAARSRFSSTWKRRRTI
jgi:dTDP-4-amino-4,6-dideoxygalactose transaminase